MRRGLILMALACAACGDANAQPAVRQAPSLVDGAADVGAADAAPGDAPTEDRAPTHGPSDAEAPDAGPVESQAGTQLVDDMLRGRCATAICFPGPGGRKNWLGIEPLLELPIGKSFSFNSGGLADFVNNSDIKVDFSAGLRVWVAQDWISFAIYLSQPLTPRDSVIRIQGSAFEYPSSYVRRPYPGLAIGLLFDTLWVSVDRDELRNGSNDALAARDPAFPRNTAVSGVWTWTVAIQPFTSFRTGIGTALSKNAAAATQAAQDQAAAAKAAQKKAEDDKVQAEKDKVAAMLEEAHAKGQRDALSDLLSKRDGGM